LQISKLEILRFLISYILYIVIIVLRFCLASRY